MALQIWQYAALSELSYRRGLPDQPLSITDISSNILYHSFGAALQDKNLYADDSMIINPSNGLTAFVVEDGGDYVVVFRGTDSSSGLKTESRNVLSYLVKPLLDSVSRTFRE